MSSPMTNSTFGAPWGASSGSGNSPVESSKATSIRPPERRVRRRQHPSIRLVWRDWCAHDDGSFLPSPRRQPPRSTQRARGNPRSPADRAEGPARVIPSSRPEASGCGHRQVACQPWIRCGRSYRGGCPSSPPWGSIDAEPMLAVTIPRSPVSLPHPRRVIPCTTAVPGSSMPWGHKAKLRSCPSAGDARSPCDSHRRSQPTLRLAWVDAAVERGGDQRAAPSVTPRAL